MGQSAASDQESVPSKESCYLTPQEVAGLLRLSAKSIYRLAKENPDMPMLKLGGTVRFPRERLERWLRDREQGRARTRSLSAVPPKSALGRGLADV